MATAWEPFGTRADPNDVLLQQVDRGKPGAERQPRPRSRRDSVSGSHGTDRQPRAQAGTGMPRTTSSRNRNSMPPGIGPLAPHEARHEGIGAARVQQRSVGAEQRAGGSSEPCRGWEVPVGRARGARGALASNRPQLRGIDQCRRGCKCSCDPRSRCGTCFCCLKLDCGIGTGTTRPSDTKPRSTCYPRWCRSSPAPRRPRSHEGCTTPIESSATGWSPCGAVSTSPGSWRSLEWSSRCTASSPSSPRT